MTHGRSGRRALAAACLLALVASGCTPAAPPPDPPTTAAPSPTPTENAQEREQRLAYAAAEKSYREFRAELYRVLRAGGAKSGTAKMKATAAGPYLKNFTELVQAYRGQKAHSTGQEKTGFVRPDGYSPTSLVLDVCEDTTGVKDFSDAGKYQGRGEIRQARLEVRRIDGAWKVWDGDGKKVDSCA